MILRKFFTFSLLFIKLREIDFFFAIYDFIDLSIDAITIALNLMKLSITVAFGQLFLGNSFHAREPKQRVQ